MTHKKLSSLEQMLTPTEVANALGLSPRTIRRWCQTRRITATRLPNGSWRCKPSVVAELIESRQTFAVCGEEGALS